MGDEILSGDVIETTDETTEQDTDQLGDTGQEVKSTTDEMVEKIARKYKVKLDGEEIDVDEDELIRNYQLRKVSDQRLQEGVKARKQAEALIQLLKTDPTKALKHPAINIDINKMAEDIIYNKLQEEMMTPEQRELNEYKRKVQEYEAAQRKAKEEETQKEQEFLHNQRKDAYIKDISEALQNSGLPRNDYTVSRVVSEMTKMIKAGYTNVSAKDVMDIVHASFVRDTKALYGSSNEETLFKLLGDEVATKIRNYDIEEYKRKNAIPKTNNVKGTGTRPVKKSKDKALTPAQLRSKIESQFGLD